MAETSLHAPEISIKAESIADILGFHVSNSLLLSVFGIILIAILGYFYQKEIAASKRSGFFYVFHSVLKSVYTLFKSILNKNIDYFFPLISAFFMWILIQNWLGLLPGVGSITLEVLEHGHTLNVPLFRSANADLNATLSLAIISMILIQVFGIKFIGLKAYLQKFFNFSSPIDFVVGLLEVVSEISKVISFAFRLFGNIFAGEVLMTIIAFISPIWLPFMTFPFLMLEIFVGFIQALVFPMLTTVFLNMAVQKHH